MNESLEIAELGNPVLREPAKPIKVIDNKIVELSGNMITTLRKAGGVGIAAPQVYESLQMFIIDSKPNERYPDAPEYGTMTVINPKIISSSEETDYFWEGCLSIPGIRGFVPRPTEIEVEFTDLNNKVVKLILKDFTSRIFQHEFDHLNGIVFLDRIESNKDIMTEKEYLRSITSNNRQHKWE
ncbi:MAG: peptide deformylase [Melioribacteraceae bacterium]|nr:peptide deformylase [Melioribacteraceae bacterium]MDD3557482.1 peptide deformylase [Melioribacteraceae bacterium]